MCALSLERMRDPVILCCSDPRQITHGHVYDRSSLCRSLLTQPDLDPKSNVRYTAPLFYVPCRPLRDYLRAQRLHEPHDDATFARDYQRAWNDHHRPSRGGGGGGGQRDAHRAEVEARIGRMEAAWEGR